MRLLNLTKGQKALVDNDIYSQIGGLRWQAVQAGSTFYASRGLARGKARKTRVLYLHHFVIGVTRLPRELGLCVDHINGNTLDNQRENLRVVTFSENARNRIAHRNGHLVGTTKITRVKNGKRYTYWEAQNLISSAKRYIGCYPTQEAAHKAFIASGGK